MKKKIIAAISAIILIAVIGVIYVFVTPKDEENGLTKINVAEVTHSAFYAPLYVAIENGFIPKNYGEVKAISKMKLDPFDYVCDDLLNKSEAKLKKQYDYILIDEAQDFKPSFYKLCRAIVKDDCLVWCYDDLQNIFDVQIQNEIETFKDSHWKNSINLELSLKRNVKN